MPYDINSPPDRIKMLPKDAQETWIKAYNSAIEQYNGDEQKANAVAWAAVEKAGYGKDKEGKWSKLREENQPGKKSDKEEVDRGDEKLRNSELLESSILSEAQEIESHVFRVQLINLEPPAVKEKGWSANNKFYTDKALENMARLMNNKRSLASGHHDDGRLRETAGILKNVIKIPDKKAIEGDYHVLGEAQQWLEPLIQEQIKTPEANLVSLSINAGGSYFWGEQGGKRGKIVENTNYAQSCDVVFNPAAGGNFKRILEEFRRSKVEKITLEELKEQRPDLVDGLIKEANTKITELDGNVKDLEAKERLHESQTLALKLISESKLTEEQAIGLLDTMLGKDEEGMKKVIEERKKFLRAIAPEVKVTNLAEKEEKSPVKPLTESEKTICKQLDLTEEGFRTGRGEQLQENKPKTDMEKLQEQINELKKKQEELKAQKGA